MASPTAEAATVAVDRVLEQVSENDSQDAWEYEYSNHETEVYYLTVDLSIPEFVEQPLRPPHHGRGGYYKHWLDDGEPKKSAAPENGGKNDDESADMISGGNLSDTSNDDESALNIDPTLRDKGKKADRRALDTINANGANLRSHTNPSAELIQILDLHSENPVISYRGHVFEGQWAEVIGTDAVLTQHDPNKPLPALRNLAGNVDFLGACSSRILTTEKKLKPKTQEPDSLTAVKEEWNINVPTGQDRTGERAPQIRFLENLMALKKKRGDPDEVTVYAKDGIGKNFKDSMHPDSRPRRRQTTVPRPSDRRPRLPRGPRGSSRRAGSGTRITSRRGLFVNHTPETMSAPTPVPCSAATPVHWEDLMDADPNRGLDEDIAEEDVGTSDGTPADSDDEANEEGFSDGGDQEDEDTPMIT